MTRSSGSPGNRSTHPRSTSSCVPTPPEPSLSSLASCENNNLGRDVGYLEYDAYPAMATKIMRRIADEIRERWDVLDIAMHHRIGRLEIGEASVAVAVASAHRGEGIEACHYGINRLKAIVPIWKKEVWSDGEEWIEGSLTPAAEIDAASD